MSLVIVVTCNRCHADFEGHFVDAALARPYVAARGWTHDKATDLDYCESCSRKRATKGTE
jgi:hypothetical protein